jgi:hypothetical protein
VFCTVFSSGETPRHAIGAVEQFANGGTLESVEIDAESMQLKVRTLSFNGQEDVLDLVRIAIAFANTANTNPLTGCEEFPVLINMGGVRFWRIAGERA